MIALKQLRKGMGNDVERLPKPCVAGSNPAGGAFPFLPGQRPVRSSAGRVGPPSGHARPSWGSRDLEKWLSSRSLTVSRSSSNRDAYTSRGHGGAAVGEASAVRTGLTVALSDRIASLPFPHP